MSVNTVTVQKVGLALAVLVMAMAGPVQAQDKPADKPAADKAAGKSEPAKAAEPAKPAAPVKIGKTPWGDPDINGTWNNPRSRVVNLTPIAASQDLEEGIGPRVSANMPGPPYLPLIKDQPNGLIPYQEWALAKVNDRRAKALAPKTEDFIPTPARCLPYGVPHTMLRGAPRMIQFPTYILMVWESPSTNRVVWMDPTRPPLDPRIKLWMGHSVGHWEGNTLVIQTTNLNAFPWLDNNGNFFSDNAVLTERYAMKDGDNITYSVSMDDPTVYKTPWRLEWPMKKEHPKPAVRQAGDGAPEMAMADEYLEIPCVEGNRQPELDLLLGGNRKASAAPEAPKDSKESAKGKGSAAKGSKT